MNNAEFVFEEWCDLKFIGSSQEQRFNDCQDTAQNFLKGKIEEDTLCSVWAFSDGSRLYLTPEQCEVLK